MSQFLTLDVGCLERFVPLSACVKLLSVSTLSVPVLVHYGEAHRFSTLRHWIVVRVGLMSQGIHVKTFS